MIATLPLEDGYYGEMTLHDARRVIEGPPVGTDKVRMEMLQRAGAAFIAENVRLNGIINVQSSKLQRALAALKS